MSETSANLSMPYLMPAQAQKHVTHNEALRVLDGVVQLAVDSRALSSPPAAPSEGGRWLVATGAAGAWEGQEGQIALHEAGGWVFLAPRPGWRMVDRETGAFLVFDGSSWNPPRGQTDNLPGIGVNAASDAVNRLTVSAAATLLTHEGAGHQLKLNKAAPGDTGSLLFQTGWSGRAEMGLAGSDEFAIKVSADGALWHEALRADPASGRAILPGGAEIAGALTGSAIVGTVSQSGGAIMESGQTSTGSYLRFADGTQICIIQFTVVSAENPIGALFMSPTYNWTFPRPFAFMPSLLGTGGSTSRWIGGIPANNTIGSLRVLSPVSVSTAITANAMAIGRWM